MKYDKIKKLIDVTNFKEQFIEKSISVMYKLSENIIVDLDKRADLIKPYIDVIEKKADVIVDYISKLYYDNYSEEQIDDLLTWHTSPTAEHERKIKLLLEPLTEDFISNTLKSALGEN